MLSPSPLIILVSKVPKVSELFELSSEQQNQYLNESNFLLQEMSVLYIDKMNIANLGNMVPQFIFISLQISRAMMPGLDLFGLFKIQKITVKPRLKLRLTR